MESMLRRLLETCSLAELGHYIPVLHEVEQVLERARERGTLSKREADMVLSKWLTQ
jgi:hypothetical protein